MASASSKQSIGSSSQESRGYCASSLKREQIAEALLFDAAGKILELLASQIFYEIGSAYGVPDEIGKLRATVETIHVRHSRHNRAATGWLQMLKDAVCSADYLLDNFSTEFLRQKTMTGSIVAKEFHLSERPNEREVSERNIRETHSYMSAEEIIGRGGDKNGIINHLSASNDVHHVSIIPIAVEKSAPKAFGADFSTILYFDEDLTKSEPTTNESSSPK
ncbi:hypothetical protein WN943_014804 [Citrus x changshan-huyou]